MRMTAWVGLLLLTGSAVSQAQTVYVTDTLYIGLKASKSDDAATIKTLKTGTQLELLPASDGEFSNVRTPQGDEGWVRNRYISQTPVSQVKLAQAEDKLAREIAENGQLKLDITEARRRVDETEKELSRLVGENERLTTENSQLREVAGKPFDASKENEKLRAENAALTGHLKAASTTQDVSMNAENRGWFVVGGAVLLGGILVGVFIPMLGFGRKRSQWTS